MHAVYLTTIKTARDDRGKLKTSLTSGAMHVQKNSCRDRWLCLVEKSRHQCHRTGCADGSRVGRLEVVPRYPQSYFEGGLALQAAEIGRVEKQWAEDGQAIVDAVQKDALSSGVKTKAVTVKSDLVSEAVIAAAKKHKCDLIVMASHGRRGIKRLLLGSETQLVLTHSHIPVLVLR